MALRMDGIVLASLMLCGMWGGFGPHQLPRADVLSRHTILQAARPTDAAWFTRRTVHILVVNADPDRPYVQPAVAGLRRALRARSVDGVLSTETERSRER